MTTPTDRPTATTFREPLLRVLGELADLRVGREVPMDDALAAVYEATGYAEDQFGKDNHGYFRVRLWVQQAFNKLLRKQGLTVKVRRGTWALTEQGVATAALLLGRDVPDDDEPLATEESEPGQEPVEDVSEEPRETPDPEAPPTPPPAYDGGEGVVWTLGDRTNTYNDDPYIRALAIAATECFGEWSARSDICADCPLSGACKGALMGRMAEVAEKLHLRDEIAALGDSVKGSGGDDDLDDIADIIEAIEDEVGGGKKAMPDGVKWMQVPAPGMCKVCRKRVETNTKVPWIRTVGMFHPECFEKEYGALPDQ